MIFGPAMLAGQGGEKFFVRLMIVCFFGLALVFAYVKGKEHSDTEWQTKWDEQVIQLANAKAAALEAVRTEEQRRIKAIEEITNESKKQIEQARADAAAADAVAVSLHDKAQRLAKRASQCTTDTATSIRSKAATATNQLLADLFQRADEAAGTMAAAYDNARAAGLACERAYDALRTKQQ